MTLLHFANCMGIASAPYFILYRFSGISEYSAFSRCIRVAIVYYVTQFLKMVLLASLFPVDPVEEESIHSQLVREAVKCTVDTIDFLGVYIILTKLLGKGEMKVTVTAVGWGVAELIGTKVIPVWVGARKVEFKWVYFQTCMDCNINLIFLLTSTTLLWLWSRHNLNKTLMPLVLAMLVAICYRPLWSHSLGLYPGMDVWTILTVKFVVACFLGLVSLQMHTAMTRD